MGKNLKGKDCGKGICQRKDGLYYARFVDKAGKRHDKYFQTLPEARNWLEEAKYADKHEDVFAATETTVDEWFNFWIILLRFFFCFLNLQIILSYLPCLSHSVELSSNTSIKRLAIIPVT